MDFPMGSRHLYPARNYGRSVSRIFILDNYDSFVYTLAGYVQQLGADVVVERNDAFAEEDIPTRLEGFDGILISPGPGTPADAGLSVAIIRYALAEHRPLFGVCLGHQAIAEAMGGIVTHAEELMHGKTSAVNHANSPLFDGVPSPFRATRYHSLAIVDGTIPDELRVTARTEGGVIMAVEHVSEPVWGVQYHPESVLTESGYTMLGNWLELTGMTGVSERARKLSPLMTADTDDR
jgi:para-aminobenzoate synthetase component 2